MFSWHFFQKFVCVICSQVSAKFDSIEFVHCYRPGNRVANYLVKIGQLQNYSVWDKRLLREVFRIGIEDVKGVIYPCLYLYLMHSHLYYKNWNKKQNLCSQVLNLQLALGLHFHRHSHHCQVKRHLSHFTRYRCLAVIDFCEDDNAK